MEMQKSQWTVEEDETLKYLCEVLKYTNWSQTTDCLNFKSRDSGNTAQQCKKRHETVLSLQAARIEWTNEQEEIFLKMHNSIGNKWSLIAQNLNDKSDNSVKNHFYSRLRKLFRRLNRIIQFILKKEKEFKTIDISVMYKIVEAVEERFKEKSGCDLEVSMECLKVEKQMLNFALSRQKQQGQQESYTQEKIAQYRQLIRNIYRVSKLYKRKSKKIRNSLIQAPVNKQRRTKKKQDKTFEGSGQVNGSKKKLTSDVQEHPIANYRVLRDRENKTPKNFVYSEYPNQNAAAESQKESKIEAKSLKVEAFPLAEEPIIKQEKNISTKNSQEATIKIEDSQQIQELLNNTGLLEFENTFECREKPRRAPGHDSNNSNNNLIVSPKINYASLSRQDSDRQISEQRDMQRASSHSSMDDLSNGENLMGFVNSNSVNLKNLASNFAMSDRSSFKRYLEVGQEDQNSKNYAFQRIRVEQVFEPNDVRAEQDGHLANEKDSQKAQENQNENGQKTQKKRSHEQ